ncbi:MAG: MFS transporter, partial [Sphingobacteriaceae bacterium]|nr:MFS transporter [Cytophagaceae bacterium]
TTVPNFVRGAVIPLTALFGLLRPHFGLVYGALLVGALTFFCALVALWFLEETFRKDLDFEEEDIPAPLLS